ncbi:protein O-mannosyl-transferase TMTC2 [Trichonephila clavata]|uniref:dolichyl-phosphate-mannose--protein mannosyltransferase n=1 Tax=Trichonephila clavata TaxID=2740835 RepID=A0A8X6HE30_TRICU|nr:protein O-mannosyl-transferase TMTC2 [Trichonephila clavata]
MDILCGFSLSLCLSERLRAIKTNQDLLPTTPILQLLTDDFWGTPMIHSGSHKSYRPLCVLSFRLNYWLGGFDPWGYHFINVLLHSIVTILFTKLASQMFLGSRFPVIVAGLLFAAHPIHTEAVAGIVGRADVGACLFFLLSMFSYMKYCDLRVREHSKKRWFYLYGSLIMATCSMLSKEQGITVIGVLIIYDVFICHKLSKREILDIPFKKQYSSLREGLLHLLAAGAAIICLRFHLMGSKAPHFAPADNPAAANDSFWTRTLTFLYLPAFNFWLLIYPKWLSFDWSMEAIPLLTGLKDKRNFGTAAFYLSIGLLGYWLIKAYRKRCICGNGSFCFVGLSGESYLTKNGLYHNNSYAHKKGGDAGCPCVQIAARNNSHNHHNRGRRSGTNHSSHYIGYRMTVGNATPPSPIGNIEFEEVTDNPTPPTRVAFASAADTLAMSMTLLIFPFIPATNLFFYVGFVIAERVLYIPSMGFCILVALGIDNFYRRCGSSKVWKGIIYILVAAMLVAMSTRTVLRNHDWLDEEDLYRSGIDINPPKAYGNLANILSGRGNKDEAEWAYKKALSYRSNMADVRYNLGILLQEQGRYEEALYTYRIAIHFRPRLAVAHLNMGLVLVTLGRKEEAMQVYRHCASLDSAGLKDPNLHETTRVSALFNLGRLYADDGQYTMAITIYHEAVTIMPENYQAQSLYNMMGEAYFLLGNYEDAEKWYREALRVKPDHIPAHLTYAKLLSKWGRLVEAERWFLKAKFIAPNDSSVYQHYGQFLSECQRHNDAADMFVKAAEIASDEYEIVFNAANTLRQAGRNSEAEAYYQVAVKLRPNEVTSHMNLGAMFHVNGKLQEAESCYIDALKLRPDDQITQNNLIKLRKLLSQRRRIFEVRNQTKVKSHGHN